jgi:hypothetical protein
MEKIIPKPSLKTWAIERFIHHRQTMELMSCAQNNHDRAVIAIVALLEVDPDIRYQGMSEDELQYIKSCHNYLLTLLENPCVIREHAAR